MIFFENYGSRATVNYKKMMVIFSTQCSLFDSQFFLGKPGIVVPRVVRLRLLVSDECCPPLHPSSPPARETIREILR